MKIWSYIIGGIVLGFLAALIPNTLITLFILNYYPQVDPSPWGGAVAFVGIITGLLVAHRMYKRSQ